MSRAPLRRPDAYTAWFPASATAWRHLVALAAAAGGVTPEVAVDDLRFRVRNGGVPGYGTLAKEWGWSVSKVQRLVAPVEPDRLPAWMDPMTIEYLSKAKLTAPMAWRTPEVQAELARQRVAADVRAYREERETTYRDAGGER